MDCLSLSEGGSLFARCYGEFVSLDWRIWLTRPPLSALALLLGAPLLLPHLRRWQRITRQKQMAHRRAEHLLRERLTPHEYKLLQKHGFLDIASHLDPHRCYRIPRYKGRVWVYEAFMLGDTLLWRKTAELCVVTIEDVPDADLVLSHKWMIEGDEAGYLALANWIRLPDTNWTMYGGAQASMQRNR